MKFCELISEKEKKIIKNAGAVYLILKWSHLLGEDGVMQLHDCMI
jgi:hypothetical protein